MRTAQLLDLIGDIYEAASEPRLWPRVLQNVASLTHATAACLPIFDTFGSLQPTFFSAFDLDDGFLREYPSYFQLNPFHAHSVLASEGKVMSGEMVVPEREFLRSAYYNEFLRRFNVCYHCGGTVLMQPSAVAILMINRPHIRSPFTDRELALLSPLMRHLKRAVQLQLRLSELDAQRQGLLEGFDALPTGFVLIDACSKVLLMNRTADAILGQNDGLAASAQSLHAARRSESEKLREILSAAAKTGARIGKQGGGAISISRPSLRRPYSLLVCPLRLTSNPFPGTPAAAVFISDPEMCVQPDTEVLRQLFGLTTAESRLAVALVQGRRLQEIAEQLQISRNTAHSQLQAVFGKTGTNRQAELLRILGSAVGSTKARVARAGAA